MGENGSEAYRLKVALVYYSSFSSFIRNDYNILSKHFEVRKVNIGSTHDITKLGKAIYWCDLSFTWFAGEHAFPAVAFSKALGKRSLVVAGGYDVACDREIGYGQFTLNWHKRAMTKFVLEQADTILAVSDFTRREVLKRSRPRRLQMIYNGVETGRFSPGDVPKEDLVLTVGGISHDTLKRKGLEAFVKSAKFVPEARFALVGKDSDGSTEYLRSIAPENVEFAGMVSDEDLLKWYRRAKVYVQASAYESFGMALAEAMLCECVPVATDRGALPEVVGNTGFFISYGDVKEMAEKIREALASEKGPEARRRITTTFSIRQREVAVVKAIRKVGD